MEEQEILKMTPIKAYARPNLEGTVIKFFSSIFEQPEVTDILIGEGGDEDVVRPQNKYPVKDENSRYNYKIVEGKLVERTLEEKVTDPEYIDYVRTRKLQEVGAVCKQLIFAGTDITTSLGLEHFSCTADDQSNIAASASAALQGVLVIPYHADGKLCRNFSASEITTLYSSVKNFVTYHVTLCNHLNVWIRRCATVDEINAITYTSKLPDDLHANFNAILGIAS